MNKFELLDWLQEEYEKWEAFLDQIGTPHMNQPGVNGPWAMKDIIAHLTGWNRWLVTRLQAAQRKEPEPLPPWPVHLHADDEINAWIYQSNRERLVDEVLDEMRQTHQQLITAIESLPDDIQIEPAYHQLYVNDKHFSASEFFDHFHDDHESDVRTWLAQIGKP